MRELPLSAEHERMGARFADVAGWHIPLDYGDVAAEQRAVRSDAGLIDWSHRGKVRVVGPEALPFLDNLLTNDLSTLTDGHGAYAALLEHHGHVVGDMAVYAVGGEFRIETEAEVAGPVYDALQRHLVSDDATLADATAEFAVFGLFGRTGRPILGRLGGGSLPLRDYDHIASTIADVDLRIARTPYLRGEGYELWIPTESDAARVWREIGSAGARPIGFAAAEALRIEAGRPKAGVDMDERTLALEARLEPAISMTKGCYLGQEVVARIVHQGHVNRLLVGIDVDGATPPTPGTPVTASGATVGTVTSAARSEALGRVIALGIVRRDHAAPGTPVAVGDRAARVAALPFVPTA